MNKHFIIQWWHEQAPLIILYLLLVGLLGLLQYLYRSPADLTSDLFVSASPFSLAGLPGLLSGITIASKRLPTTHRLKQLPLLS